MTMRRLGPLDVALLGTGSTVLVVLALSERYQQLGAGALAYGVAWWVLGLERSDRRRTTGTEPGEPR